MLFSVSLADYAVGSFLDHAEVACMPMEAWKQIQCWYVDIEGLDEWKQSAPSNFMQGKKIKKGETNDTT